MHFWLISVEYLGALFPLIGRQQLFWLGQGLPSYRWFKEFNFQLLFPARAAAC